MPRTSPLAPLVFVLALGVCPCLTHPVAASEHIPVPDRPGTTSIQSRGQSSPQGRSVPWLERLRRWTAATFDHTAGVSDAALNEAATLTVADLDAVAADLGAIRERLVRALKPPQPEFEIRHHGDVVTVAEILRTLRLTDGEAAAGDFNALVKRGAALHTDVAILQPGALAGAVDRAHSTVLIEDGRHIGYDARGVHWILSRALLDLVRPTPAADADVHRWYVAVGALLRRSYDYDAAHLDRARLLFPDDPEILFLSGCRHEALAAPRVQGFVGSAPPGTYNIGSAARELADAERFFRRVVQLAPQRIEFRMRLARVLTLRDRASEAVDLLADREAGLLAGNDTDETLRYFAAMFLGEAQQRAGRRDAARDAYDAASALFPRAQSPYLALAQLARSQPDRAGAGAALERLFARTGFAELSYDPWWDYFGGTVDSKDALADEVRSSLQGGPQ